MLPCRPQSTPAKGAHLEGLVCMVQDLAQRCSLGSVVLVHEQAECVHHHGALRSTI